MAKIASETRIYRETKKFLNEVIYVIKDFPKEQRYVVGDRIERTAIDSLHITLRPIFIHGYTPISVESLYIHNLSILYIHTYMSQRYGKLSINTFELLLF